ncbi:MAG TPA: hypothetical protein VLB73_00625 [Patescibacteria group bacterium]|nr:hypothetical protein [Patescibacteria group bacterium]
MADRRSPGYRREWAHALNLMDEAARKLARKSKDQTLQELTGVPAIPTEAHSPTTREPAQVPSKENR